MDTTIKSANKTQPRAKKGTIAVPENLPATVVEANGAPAATPAPDTGTAVIASTLPAASKNDASPAAAVVADGAKNNAPVSVPATPDPNAPTADQLIALKESINAAYLAFFSSRPNAVDVAEVLPLSDEEIESLGDALYASLSSTESKISRKTAYSRVETEHAIKMAAAAEARKQTAPIADLWAGAAVVVFNDVTANVKATISSKRATKAVTSADGAVRESKPRAVTGTAAEKAKKLIAHCASKGLDHVDFIDAYKAGYQGEFHCLRLHEDGRYEKLDYDAETQTVTPTGEMLNGWKYFVSKNDGKAPQYSIHQMYGILDPQGLLDRAGPARAGWATHLADVELVVKDANS